MSTTFIEATSKDPFVLNLYRRAMRLLNDRSLDRAQREAQIRKLQSVLLEHQAKQAVMAEKHAAKRKQGSRTNRNQGIADQSQVLARRKEFDCAHADIVEPVEAVPVLGTAQQASDSSKVSQPSKLNRAVLTLRRD